MNLVEEQEIDCRKNVVEKIL